MLEAERQATALEVMMGLLVSSVAVASAADQAVVKGTDVDSAAVQAVVSEVGTGWEVEVEVEVEVAEIVRNALNWLVLKRFNKGSGRKWMSWRTYCDRTTSHPTSR